MSVLEEAAEKGPLAGTGRKDCREKFIVQARRFALLRVASSRVAAYRWPLGGGRGLVWPARRRALWLNLVELGQDRVL